MYMIFFFFLSVNKLVLDRGSRRRGGELGASGLAYQAGGPRFPGNWKRWAHRSVKGKRPAACAAEAGDTCMHDIVARL